MMVWGYTLGSVAVVCAIAFIGIFTFSMKVKKLEKIVLYLVSLSAGALLGDAFLHLLPEAAEAGFTLQVSMSVLTGIIFLFIIERLIAWRHCHMLPRKKYCHPFAYVNLIGDMVHNFIDGLVIAAAYLINIPVGIATTIAVIFHEIPQEIGDFGVLVHGGFTKQKALIFNVLTGLAAFVGAILGLILAASIEGVTKFLIPFAAGSFIYIAGTDLIPELHKERDMKRQLIQTFLFLVGIAIMYVLTFYE